MLQLHNFLTVFSTYKLRHFPLKKCRLICLALTSSTISIIDYILSISSYYSPRLVSFIKMNDTWVFVSKGKCLPRSDSWEGEREKKEKEYEREKKSESKNDPDTREASKGVAVYFQIARPAKGINVGAKTAHPCLFPAPLPPTEKVTMSSRLYIPLFVSISAVWGVYARKKTQTA